MINILETRFYIFCSKIQSVFQLSDGSGLAVTVARYETPAHTDIDKVRTCSVMTPFVHFTFCFLFLNLLVAGFWNRWVLLLIIRCQSHFRRTKRLSVDALRILQLLVISIKAFFSLDDILICSYFVPSKIH